MNKQINCSRSPRSNMFKSYRPASAPQDQNKAYHRNARGSSHYVAFGLLAVGLLSLFSTASAIVTEPRDPDAYSTTTQSALEQDLLSDSPALALLDEDSVLKPFSEDPAEEAHVILAPDDKELAVNSPSTGANAFMEGRGFLEPLFRPEQAFELVMPLRDYVVSSRFGWRHHRPHRGIDLAARTGEPILASEAGTVVMARRYSGYGNFVVVDHGNGIKTRYAHMSRIAVRHGRRVQQGEVLGYVGSTGRSSGPHLHFEVLNQGIHQNPEHYILRQAG